MFYRILCDTCMYKQFYLSVKLGSKLCVSGRHFFLLATVAILISLSHTQFQLATLNINKEHKTVESSKLYYLINYKQ